MQAHYFLGIALYEQTSLPEAVQQLTQVISGTPDVSLFLIILHVTLVPMSIASLIDHHLNVL